MSMAELCQELGVSESTIRRDLEALEEEGLIRRTHGGAVYIQDTPGHRYSFSERETAMAAEKAAIGAAVAELIPPGQTVILNGGTSCLEVARALRGRHMSVVTNSVPIASLLSAELATEVTLIGGYVYPRTGVALGAMAEQHLAMLRASQVVLSCAGVTAEGIYNANQMMVDCEQKMTEVADEVILAVDHTKFGKQSVVRLGGLDAVDLIVTDDGCDEDVRQWLSQAGTRVVYAETVRTPAARRTAGS
jgi:DeoR/GlpR family transcriptional regulator of sugar metabolism